MFCQNISASSMRSSLIKFIVRMRTVTENNSKSEWQFIAKPENKPQMPRKRQAKRRTLQKSHQPGSNSIRKRIVPLWWLFWVHVEMFLSKTDHVYGSAHEEACLLRLFLGQPAKKAFDTVPALLCFSWSIFFWKWIINNRINILTLPGKGWPRKLARIMNSVLKRDNKSSGWDLNCFFGGLNNVLKKPSGWQFVYNFFRAWKKVSERKDYKIMFKPNESR